MNLHGILLLGNDMIIPRDPRDWSNTPWRNDIQVYCDDGDGIDDDSRESGDSDEAAEIKARLQLQQQEQRTRSNGVKNFVSRGGHMLALRARLELKF